MPAKAVLIEPTEFTPAERELQLEVREFIARELKPGTYTPSLGMNALSDKAFSRKMAKQGYLGMALPKEYGGRARSAVDRFIVVEELLRVGAPLGYHWVADRQSGPVIAKFGTEEQKARFLPGICAGELGFCIGMSEPNSGSDLASVATKATKVDGGWLLNGRKIWTTFADVNDWAIVLCRTTPADEVKDKRAGMSQFLVDLKSPGLEITPIPFIDGTADFCEVAYQDVFVPDNLVLGSVGEGWAQNTSELAYERGGPDRWLSTYLIVENYLAQQDENAPAEVLATLGWATANYWVLHNMSLAVARSIDTGGAPAVESSLTKEIGTRFEQDILNAIVRLLDEPPSLPAKTMFEQLLATAIMTAPSFTIRGGTNEILRSVIARGVNAGGAQ